MQIEEKIFKAYDIRGLYPSEINEEAAYAIGRAFVDYLKPQKVAVGYDVRLSSPDLAKSLIKGITDQGADVVEIGLAATPMLYFAVSEYGFDAGVMITASHNSREYNGLKLVDKEAVPLNINMGLSDIKEAILKNKFSVSENRGQVEKKEILKDYISNIFKFIQPNEIAPGLRVAVDAANGMAGLVLPEVFDRLSCDVISLFWNLDGAFPNHLPDPKRENLGELIEKVKGEKASLGVAVDGDADRIVFVDEKGNVISGNLIIALLSKMILQSNPGAKIIYDLRAGWAVRDVIQENKGKGIMCRVGHSFIKKKMKEEKAIFAGELSGHYYLGRNDGFESTFIILLYLLKLISQTKQKMSDLIKPFRKYYNTGEINFEVEDKDKIFEKLEAHFHQYNPLYIDGLSVEFKDWWFNLRQSNTEPVLRLIIESKDKYILEEKKNELIGLIGGTIRR